MTAKTTYTANFVRSSIVPHTIARLTVQKTTSNRNFADSGTAEKESESNSELCRKKPSVPNTSLPLPNARPNPTAQNATVPIERLTRIFATTAPTFLPREKPTSSMAKPACMRNTMHAATMTQTVSIATFMSVSCCSCSGDIPASFASGPRKKPPRNPGTASLPPSGLRRPL